MYRQTRLFNNHEFTRARFTFYQQKKVCDVTDLKRHAKHCIVLEFEIIKLIHQLMLTKYLPIGCVVPFSIAAATARASFSQFGTQQVITLGLLPPWCP